MEYIDIIFMTCAFYGAYAIGKDARKRLKEIWKKNKKWLSCLWD